MREIKALEITQAIKKMVMDANYDLPEDIAGALKKARDSEKWIIASDTLGRLVDNAQIAKAERVPMCQDTGMVVVFAEIGQDVHITGGFIDDAINEGIRQGYKEGYLRNSVVGDPLNRENTKDNTPAVINVKIVPGDRLRLIAAPKGFGSENMSRLKMLKPSDGYEGVVDFVLETVRLAGPNACPPLVVGVGIGGTFDRAAFLAKRSLMRPIDQRNSNPFYAKMEEELLDKINKLGIGPQGYGGKTTALGVSIETYATHIAGLPVAVNINCHATRHKEIIL